MQFPRNRPLTPPIFLSTAWRFASLEEASAIYDGDRSGVAYGAHGAPNQRALETTLSRLEAAEDALVTSGGMAAISVAFDTLLRPGARVVAGRDLFGPTIRLLRSLEAWGVETVFVDCCDLEATSTALHTDTDLLYVETISNPRLRVPDIQRLAEVAHRAGARLLVDNTFASPAVCRPLQLGADLVVEAATKYLSGHSDVVLGLVAGPEQIIAELRTATALRGLTPGGFEAWLVQRGLETYDLRMERITQNAASLAAQMTRWAEITAVHYPGLQQHPDHDIAADTLHLPSPILAFEMSGDQRTVEHFVAGLHIVAFASSLGATRSTIAHPATMTHGALSSADRLALGVHDALLRLSVGTESIAALEAELRAAVRAATTHAVAASGP